MAQPGQPRQRPAGQGSQPRDGNRNRSHGNRQGGNNRGPGGNGGGGDGNGQPGGHSRGSHRSKHRHGRHRDRDRDPNANRNPGQHPQQRSPQRQRQEEVIPEPVKTVPKRYGLVLYETFAAARNDLENLAAKAKEFDQLNICVRAEGDMDDPELCKFGKVFAGEAWTLIHERRVADGWYNEPH